MAWITTPLSSEEMQALSIGFYPNYHASSMYNYYMWVKHDYGIDEISTQLAKAKLKARELTRRAKQHIIQPLLTSRRLLNHNSRSQSTVKLDSFY